MVHIHDEGSEFDASVDVVWSYLDSGHRGIHKSFRNLKVVNISQNSDLITAEQKMGGQWMKNTSRVIEFRPLGVSIETLVGPLAGSKQFAYYTPKGNKTAITVVGEFVSRDIPESQLVSMVNEMLQEIYDEDVAGLRLFDSKKKK
jgi:hypothetical protein